MIWSWSDYLDCYNLDSKKFIIASCTPTSVVYRNFFKTGYFSNDLIDLAIAVRKRDKDKFSSGVLFELFELLPKSNLLNKLDLRLFVVELSSIASGAYGVLVPVQDIKNIDIKSKNSKFLIEYLLNRLIFIVILK